MKLFCKLFISSLCVVIIDLLVYFQAQCHRLVRRGRFVAHGSDVTMWEAAHAREESSAPHFIQCHVSFLETKCISTKTNYSSLTSRALISP